ncbi:MAG: hypothetical protein K0R63_1374 [Rickettsiales bacterium]|jgi:hypothetical protein|nr:hypothetical protein [Rickettsiales bacterium]
MQRFSFSHKILFLIGCLCLMASPVIAQEQTQNSWDASVAGSSNEPMDAPEAPSDQPQDTAEALPETAPAETQQQAEISPETLEEPAQTSDTAVIEGQTEQPVESAATEEEDQDETFGDPDTISAQPLEPLNVPDGTQPPATDPALEEENLPEAGTQGIATDENALSGYTPKVRLQGLNKITARTFPLNLKAEEHVSFDILEVVVHKCWKSPPEQRPESKALIEVWEHKGGEDKKQIFYGWMFASSPSLSALEHPVYDLVVVECTK